MNLQERPGQQKSSLPVDQGCEENCNSKYPGVDFQRPEQGTFPDRYIGVTAGTGPGCGSVLFQFFFLLLFGQVLARRRVDRSDSPVRVLDSRRNALHAGKHHTGKLWQCPFPILLPAPLRASPQTSVYSGETDGQSGTRFF